MSLYFQFPAIDDYPVIIPNVKDEEKKQVSLQENPEGLNEEPPDLKTGQLTDRKVAVS